MSADERVAGIAALIERYLAVNPSAADSALGIAHWWLPSAGMDVAPEEVERALLLLEARGVVEGVQVAGRQQLWRAAAHGARP